MIGVALVALPKLALGLSGFETGVLVMPQVAAGKGAAGERLARRRTGSGTSSYRRAVGMPRLGGGR